MEVFGKDEQQQALHPLGSDLGDRRGELDRRPLTSTATSTTGTFRDTLHSPAPYPDRHYYLPNHNFNLNLILTSTLQLCVKPQTLQMHTRA